VERAVWPVLVVVAAVDAEDMLEIVHEEADEFANPMGDRPSSETA
jgi:hypothetical protein